MPEPVALGFGCKWNHSWALAGLQPLRNWPHTPSGGSTSHSVTLYPVLESRGPGWSGDLLSGQQMLLGGAGVATHPPTVALSGRLHPSSRQGVDNHSFPCWAPADRRDDCYYYYCCYLLGLLCHAPLESGESLPARLRVGQKHR